MLLKEFLQASFFQSKFLRLSFVVINSNDIGSNISLPRLSYYISKKIILWSILYVDQLYERMLMRSFTGMRKEEENRRGRRGSRYVCLRVEPDIHRDRRVGATEARQTKNRRCRGFLFVSSTISHHAPAYFATCVGQYQFQHCTFLGLKTSSNILPFLLSSSRIRSSNNSRRHPEVSLFTIVQWDGRIVALVMFPSPLLP